MTSKLPKTSLGLDLVSEGENRTLFGLNLESFLPISGLQNTVKIASNSSAILRLIVQKGTKK